MAVKLEQADNQHILQNWCRLNKEKMYLCLTAIWDRPKRNIYIYCKAGVGRIMRNLLMANNQHILQNQGQPDEEKVY